MFRKWLYTTLLEPTTKPTRPLQAQDLPVPRLQAGANLQAPPTRPGVNGRARVLVARGQPGSAPSPQSTGRALRPRGHRRGGRRNGARHAHRAWRSTRSSGTPADVPLGRSRSGPLVARISGRHPGGDGGVEFDGILKARLLADTRFSEPLYVLLAVLTGGLVALDQSARRHVGGAGGGAGLVGWHPSTTRRQGSRRRAAARLPDHRGSVRGYTGMALPSCAPLLEPRAGSCSRFRTAGSNHG